MFAINVDNSDLENTKDLYGATDKQFDTARARALRKLNKRIETRVKSVAAKRLRIPQKAIKDRFFSNKIQPGDDELTVWIGTWAVSPFSIGKPSQNSTGVRAGRRSYPGAFLAEIYSSQTKVWIRASSKHFSPELYPTKYRPGDRGMGRDSSGRFPVVRAAVPIDGVIEEIFRTEGDSFSDEFGVIFERELNYEVNVKGA